MSLTDPKNGNTFRRLLTKRQVFNNLLRVGRERDLQNDQAFCSDDLFSKKNLLGDWNTTSPSIAAMRLYCGVIAFKDPVSKGEPSVTSSGYSVSNLSISDSDAFGKK